MTPAFKNHRPHDCLADHPNHHNAVAVAVHLQIWELHVGTVQLFIVGPGPTAWLACSETCYTGRIGTDEERNLARRAVAILNRTHREDKDAGPNEIRAALQQADREIHLASDLSRHSPKATPDGPRDSSRPSFIHSSDPEPEPGQIDSCEISQPSPPRHPHRATGQAWPGRSMPQRGKTRDRKPDTAAILAVIRIVADAAGLTPADFIGRDLARRVCDARHLAIATVCQEFPQLTSTQVAEIFHRDRSLIGHAIQNAASLRQTDTAYQQLHARVQDALLTAAVA